MLNQISLNREFSSDVRSILQIADKEALSLGDQELYAHHLLLALAAHGRGVTRILLDRLKVTHDGLIKLLADIQQSDNSRKESTDADSQSEGKEVANEAKSPDKVQRTKR